MSSRILNADDLFEIARRIERNGAAFYRAAAKLMPDEAGAKLLRDLAETEIVHEHTLASMQNALSGDEAAGPLYDTNEEAYGFLKEMANDFAGDPERDVATVLKPGSSVRTILETAIQREKDSVIFYEGIKMIVPRKLGGPRLDEIIAQEMGHIIVLCRERARVS